MSMADVQRREARLIILRFLGDEVNRTLTSSALTIQLNEMFLFNKDRSWVEQEIAYLAEMGAVKVTSAGTVKIARLMPHGARHLSWGVAIPDVQRTSEPIVLPEAVG
jgi:hypothetical protein